MDEIIIDTIVLDYLTRNQKALSPTARKRIEQADTVYVSVVSLWELANHIREGLIILDADFDSFYQRSTPNVRYYVVGYAMVGTQLFSHL